MKCASRPDKAASGEGKKNELNVPEKIGRMKTGKVAVSRRAHRNEQEIANKQ